MAKQKWHHHIMWQFLIPSRIPFAVLNVSKLKIWNIVFAASPLSVWIAKLWSWGRLNKIPAKIELLPTTTVISPPNQKKTGQPCRAEEQPLDEGRRIQGPPVVSIC